MAAGLVSARRKEQHPKQLQKTKNRLLFTEELQAVHEHAGVDRHPLAVNRIRRVPCSSKRAASPVPHSCSNNSRHSSSSVGDTVDAGAAASATTSDVSRRDTVDGAAASATSGVSRTRVECLEEEKQARKKCNKEIVQIDVTDDDQDDDDDKAAAVVSDGGSGRGSQEFSATCKVESYKIKWSVKRKKKKRLRLQIPQRPRKILILGDMYVGKSNLITTYCRDRFVESYCPTFLHCCVSDVEVMGRDIPIILTEASGRDDYKRIRCCSYYKIDIVILCYSATDRNSLERIRSHWLPELKECAPGLPFVVTETKKDVRDEHLDKKNQLEREGRTDSQHYREICRKLEEEIVTEGAGAAMCKEVGGEKFFVTSARYRIGTRKMFQEATLLAMKKTRRRRRRC